jgi:DNA-binding transcriptional LysR family regulator
MRQYPLLSVEMTVSNHREEMMTGADVAIRFGPTDDSSLIARKLLETRVLTCAAPVYIQKRGVPATPHDLIHHEALLFRDPQTGRPFLWEFARKGKVIEINVRGRFTTDDASTAVADGSRASGNLSGSWGVAKSLPKQSIEVVEVAIA